MQLNLYFFIFILCSTIKAYILYKFFHLFFKEKQSPFVIEILSYALFTIANAVIYIFVDLSILTLIFNILGRYLLTYNYKGKQKNRIFITLFFCLMAMLIETFVVFASTAVPIDILAKSSYDLIQGPIFTTIFIYLFVLIMERWKNTDRQIHIPFLYWIMLIIIPLSSLFITLFIIIYGNMTENSIAICCLLFFLINLSAFNLYDKVLGYLSKKMENHILAQQNMYYNKLLENIEMSNESIRALRHDLKNHVIAMEGLLKREEYDHLSQYLHGAFHGVLIDDSFISTGNTTIDSILNFKIKEANNKGMQLLTEIAIPTDLKLSNEILTVIIGNLLDNAMEATSIVKEQKEIKFKLFYDRECLFITVSNPYEGILQRNEHTFLTTKPDKDCHGYGLNNIRKLIKSYRGNIEIDDENQRFTIHITLYDIES